ncbi:MAG: hypothetical protein N3D84_02445 [Candidatus Woesearchaeota archaeon]|nr:hypothetical protein [Candidatus Woesearchaeota archaeon]
MDYKESCKENWPHFKQNSRIYIPDVVAPSNFTLIQVEVSSSTKDVKGLSSVIYENTPDDAAQRLLLSAMLWHLYGDLSKKEVIKYTRHLD